MRIRKATTKDIPEIARLMLAEFSKPPFEEKESISSVRKSLEFYLKIGRGFVAVEDGIIGVIIFKAEQWWEGPVILVEDLAVDHEHKRKGVGKSLVDEVEEYAKENKARLVSFTTHRKSSAVSFYKRHGYRVEKDTVFMSKRIR